MALEKKPEKVVTFDDVWKYYADFDQDQQKMRAITDEKGNIVNDGKKLPENYFQISKSDSESSSSLSSVSSKSLDS